MNRLVLLTGGNLGQREAILAQAFELISRRVGAVTAYSPLIESEPWGFESEHTFLNQVLIVHTELDAANVLQRIQKIEHELGRERKNGRQWISRNIDIDILFFNDDIIETEKLIIPHKHLHQRRFTLYALDRIIPDYVHPVLKSRIHDLLKNCTDPSKVEEYHA
jgi:2-amino-4-hydroxy-6-hydroxymethyldihydropteridine diphosphokinase